MDLHFRDLGKFLYLLTPVFNYTFRIKYIAVNL